MSEINDLLNADPLGEAEALTGKSYKNDEDTLALGMLLHLVKGREVREEMGLRDDTYYGSLFADALRIFEELGFEVVHQYAYTLTSGWSEPREEQYVLLWRDGVLATLSSYNGDTVNSANLYYNWEADEGVNPFSFGASGHLHGDSYDEDKKVWIGYQDVRTGLRHILNRLESNGRFLSTWVERPFMYLLDSAEDKAGADYKAINAAKIAAFPAEVIKALGPEDD